MQLRNTEPSQLHSSSKTGIHPFQLSFNKKKWFAFNRKKLKSSGLGHQSAVANGPKRGETLEGIPDPAPDLVSPSQGPWWGAQERVNQHLWQGWWGGDVGFANGWMS